jgi:hypothetical protein
MSISSDKTRCFLIVYILVGIWAFSNALGEIAEYRVKQLLGQRRARLQNIVLTKEAIAKMDRDPDGAEKADGRISCKIPFIILFVVEPSVHTALNLLQLASS